MKRNLIFLDILSQTAWTEISFNFGSFFVMTLGVLLIIVQAGSKIRPFNLIFICCLNSVGNSSEEYRRLGFAGFAVRWSVIYMNKAFLHWTFQAQRIPWYWFLLETCPQQMLRYISQINFSAIIRCREYFIALNFAPLAYHKMFCVIFHFEETPISCFRNWRLLERAAIFRDKLWASL